MFKSIGFRNQLGIIFSAGILLLALVSTLVISGLSGHAVRERLIDEGLRLVESFAEQSTLALLYRSDDSAAESAAALLAFPDVLSTEIFDKDGTPLFARGQSLPPPQAGWQAAVALSRETADAWQFTAPVYLGSEERENDPFGEGRGEAELIGYVRMAMGKETLKTLGMDIFRYNLIVSLSLAALLLMALLAITQRVTRPLQDLAGIMRRAERGESGVRAQLRGTSDIRDMESAFNTMMNVLDGRESALKKARDQALESARSKAEFAANVSHELRTPMNGVLGMLDLLADSPSAEKRAEYVDVARSSAESLLVLIDELLSFSKSEAGKLTLELDDFQLERQLDEVVALLGPEAQRKQLDLAYVVEAGIPSLLTGDGARLRQVLVNLCGNAIKFTGRGSVHIEVSALETLPGRVTLRFAVCDTGVGIGRSQQSRIFEAFSQADESTTRRYGGTGLGLAISRQLVHLMGGEIGLDSVPGEGSTFWFTLPLLRPSGTAVPVSQQRSLEPHLRVLVADNCAPVRRSLAGLFDRRDTFCELAADYPEAVRKLQMAGQGVPYSLIIVDEALDHDRGRELISYVAAHPSYAKAHGLLMVKRQVGSAEWRVSERWATVAKPLSHDALVAEVNRLLLHDPRQSEGAVAAQPADDQCHNLFRGSRILVVEDDRANQRVVLGMLEMLGCAADLVSNGRECLEQIARVSYDLVLMDCHMPELDGYKAAAIIRDFEADNSHIPIIAMTASVRQGDADRCLAVGMDDYLAKPLNRGALRIALQRWLDVDLTAPHPRGQALRESVATDLSTLQEAANDQQVLSVQVLRNLAEQLGPAMERMLDALAEDLPVYLEPLAAAAAAGNCEQVAQLAHTIKGTAGNIGAARLVDSCALVELGARADEPELAGVETLLLAGRELLVPLLGGELQQWLRGAPVAPRAKADPGALAAAQRSGNAEILIVDDDRGSRLAMVEVLRNEGYLVHEAVDGEQALMHCERQPPDLILMDAVMPQMDGFTACAALQKRAQTRSIPVLIITALNDEGSINRAFTSGATDYISKPVNFWVLSRRINHLVQARDAQRHVHRLAYNDTLTGLPNRVMFNERFREASGRMQGSAGELAILFLDLDRFKLVNDTLGHETGDLLLKYFAERVQGCLRKQDMVARFGGDEFTILLDRVKSRDTVRQVAEKIHDQLARPFVFMGREMYVSTSIGVAIYPGHGRDIGTLLKNADMAMYRAKKLGESYRLYEARMEADVCRQLELENDLRGALERGEFELYYQPQEDLTSGAVIAVEALLRWQHPERGLVGPDEFIGLAEQTAQIIPLGEWVLRQVCLQLQAWRAQGFGVIRGSVNISGKQLCQPDLVAVVGAILAETGLPPEHLELEITESILMEDPEQVILTLEQLKGMGLSLAIDDFGTGYSALNYLRRFPVDVIKIDRSFIADLIGNQVDADIVKTIIDLAHVLGVRVVAEGVETELQKVFLKKQGCDMAQGYYLSRPVVSASIGQSFLTPVDLAGGAGTR